MKILFTTLTFVLSLPVLATSAEEPKLALDTALRAAAFCDSKTWEAKVYVGEDFLQKPSAVVVALTLKNPALRQSFVAVTEGEFVLDSQVQAFRYVLRFEGNEIARLAVKQSGEDVALIGKIAFEEEMTVDCK